MANPRSLCITLQREITPNDTVWNYTVRNLPQQNVLVTNKLVKSLAVVSSHTEQHIRLRLEPMPDNRITKMEPADRFLLISFANFRLRFQDDSTEARVQFVPARDTAEYIAKMLRSGIELNDVRYHFFGHSNSQLKSRSCFLYAASPSEIARKIEAMGDFSTLKSVGKKAKRIGLLFSSAEMALLLPADRCEDIDDVKSGDYTFSDGCGLLSVQLARQIVQRRKIVYRNQRHQPSVFQIRYRGYKGVLMVDPRLGGGTQVQFRHSMRKFKDAEDMSLAVVDYSKPYTFGYLNDEIVLLLHALGVSTETLLQKQADHLDLLQRVTQGDSRSAFQFLSFIERLDLAEKLLIEGTSCIQISLCSLVREQRARLLNKRDEQRCRILVPQSRLLFGVCDPTGRADQLGKLRPGTCFVRITSLDDGRPRTLVNTEVLVTRNPCLHPGDLQKFEVVDVPEFAHLIDCVVFPTCGKRPSADLMSGGDLDGDKFFVTWDPGIIPRIMSQPARYPGPKEPVSFDEVTDEDRAEYFAHYTNTSVGRVKKLFLKWARLKGPMSPECQQLNRLFSQCVDGNRIKVPSDLEDFPSETSQTPPFILDIMHDAARQIIQSTQDERTDLANDGDLDALEALLARDSNAISEFSLLKLALNWCKCNEMDFAKLTPFFNFSSLSDEEKAWTLAQLPPVPEYPRLLQNGLVQSHILSPADLSRFALDHHKLRWKPVFQSRTDRMGRFMETACRSLQLFHKKLIVFKADERLTLMIYIPQKAAKASEVSVDDRIRIFTVPHSQGHDSVAYRITPTKVNYRLYCDNSVFELYELERAQTFIKLTRGAMDDALYRSTESRGDRRRQQQATIDDGTNFDCRASVALDKISRAIQTHVGRMKHSGIIAAEIYVISNRDVESMLVLDQWLHYIDTEETLPLFNKSLREYEIPTFQNLDWSKASTLTSTILRSKDFAAILQVGSAQDLSEILNFLLDHELHEEVYRIFGQILENTQRFQPSVDGLSLCRCLLEILLSAPYLAILLFPSSLWICHQDGLREYLTEIAANLLRGLILSANHMSILIKSPVKTVLQALNSPTVQRLADTLELISLCVRDPQVAMDLMFECIEPEIVKLPGGKQLSMNLFGIALDHLDEANSGERSMRDTITLTPDGISDGFTAVKCTLRIDREGGILKAGDHVRLTTSNQPQNAPLARPISIDALVVSSEPSRARIRCFHRLPAFFENCDWNLDNCGSFVTSKTMFDAVAAFYGGKDAQCGLYTALTGSQNTTSSGPGHELLTVGSASLNEGQNRALTAALAHSLTFLWGPPGTGKTHTIVKILKNLLLSFPEFRILVTAPTHNAVDHILQRFIEDGGTSNNEIDPVRVSTDVSKVASNLRKYTCDAMVGKDLNENFVGRRAAQNRVKRSKLVFTTCAGAGLGLLRPESFQVVLIDEASQQTEPASLIPLVKGCQRAVLVGDHVQLRATVQKHALAVEFDVSLFERHYRKAHAADVAKVMLETQYRMHPEICAFSSAEFYEGKLQTGNIKVCDLSQSSFPWPQDARQVFIQCSTPEDLGNRSKMNKGQVAACKEVCKLLDGPCQGALGHSQVQSGRPSVAILTPYTRQRELLASHITAHDVFTVDGYQGREADIIILVTVRCNQHFETGFLRDMRRLNVAMTRARAGVIIIGDKRTLTTIQYASTDAQDSQPAQSVDESDSHSKQVWSRLLASCMEVKLTVDDDKKGR